MTIFKQMTNALKMRYFHFLLSKHRFSTLVSMFCNSQYSEHGTSPCTNCLNNYLNLKHDHFLSNLFIQIIKIFHKGQVFKYNYFLEIKSIKPPFINIGIEHVQNIEIILYYLPLTQAESLFFNMAPQINVWFKCI